MESKKSDNQNIKDDMDIKDQSGNGEEKRNDNEPDTDEAADKKSKSRKKLKHSLEEEYKEKIDELNDKFLRLYSEFDNYRRRTAKEKLELVKTASEELIVELLPVLDDFERAIKSAEEVKDCDAVKQGIQLIYNKFSTVLSKKGLTPIQATGQVFDTDFHEAITYIPAPSDEQKGQVVDEVEKGYKLYDKVIRYTKVIIGQ